MRHNIYGYQIIKLGLKHKVLKLYLNKFPMVLNTISLVINIKKYYPSYANDIFFGKKFILLFCNVFN